jgi:hypothetical protein
MPATNQIDIDLNSPVELFEEPASDPWDPATRYRSGIDEIWAKLRSIPIHAPVAITIRLPDEALTVGLEMRTKDAITRYCDAKIEAVTNERVAVIKEGRRDFILSIVTVLGLFLIIALLVRVFQMEGALLTALVAWTGIAAWAILWNPVDSFVWARTPLRREIYLWEKLKGSDLSVRARLDSEV